MRPSDEKQKGVIVVKKVVQSLLGRRGGVQYIRVQAVLIMFLYKTFMNV